MGKEKNMQVKMKIVEVKKLNYYEKPFNDFNFKTKMQKGKIPIEIGMNLGVQRPEGILNFLIKVNFYHIENEKRVELFGINTSHKFHISNFDEVIKIDKKGMAELNNVLLTTLFSISISGTRGMLALLNTSDDYKDIVLPIMDPTTLLKNIKNQNFIK